jgi:aconitate decarboxylase
MKDCILQPRSINYPNGGQKSELGQRGQKLPHGDDMSGQPNPSNPNAELRNGSPTSDRLIDLILAHEFDDLPPEAVAAAKTFIADTLAVGVAGSGQPSAAKILSALTQRGDCGILGKPGQSFSEHEAALLNGFQIHCLEWDGLHEHSVVIALCVTTAALTSEVQQRSKTNPITGKQFINAFITGIETAVWFGSAAATGPRFFRPSTAGLMGAAMAIGRTRGYSKAQMLDLLGLAYSQVGGTMQAHWEGSEALAMQIGFAARGALTAADLVQAGLTGPHNVIDGKFGYFSLIETPNSLEDVFGRWGSPWKVTELAHKPFPAGRATQAALTAIIDIKQEAEFGMDDVEALTVHVPPLINLLVGRAFDPAMSAEYARLCMQFVAPQMIEHGLIDPRRFISDVFNSAEAKAHAARVHVVLDDNPDPNALSPQTIVLKLKDGRVFERHVTTPLGSPGNELSLDAQIKKAQFCFEIGCLDRSSELLFETVSRLDQLDDAAQIFHIVTR